MDFWHSVFGPSKKEIWEQVARDIQGKFEEGGWLGADVLRYRSGNWEITLDTFTTSTGKSSATYTRMRAPFLNKDGLRFEVFRENFFTSISKALGWQDILIGDRFFDDNFIIRGNNEDKVRQLLQNDTMIHLIQLQPDIWFTVRDDEGWFATTFPEGVDELYFQCYGTLTEEELLINLFNLFTLTLERLVQMDSAYESDPNIRL